MLTKEKAAELHKALAETLRKFGVENNISISTGTFTYMSDSFSIKVTGVLKNPDSEEQAESNVSAEDVVRLRRDFIWKNLENKTFVIKNTMYKIVGLRSGTNAIVRNMETGNLHLVKTAFIEATQPHLFK